MDCQICGKNSATIHFTELSGGKKIEVHVCRHCADEKGLLIDAGQYAAELWDKPGGGRSDSKTFACRVCGMKYSDFKASGRLGCGACYEAFRDELGPVIQKIHGSSVHLGKAPDLSGEALRRRILFQHRRKLRELVSQERFEEASRIRDVIKNLEE